MPDWLWILIAVGVLIVIAAVVWTVVARRRREHLRERFGPEYDRAVDEHDDQRSAEAELERREKQRERLDIVPLAPESRERYLASWRELQTGFVDEPERSVGEADKLVTEVMRERGYPMDEFDRRVADISVDHPNVVEHYREAHGISTASENGEASTEDLRQAVVHYRALFEELVEEPETAKQGVR